MHYSLTFKGVEIQFAKVTRKQRKKNKNSDSKLTIEEMTELLQKKEIL